MVKNFIKMISDPDLFTPTIYLVPEVIEYGRKNDYSCTCASKC